jgi:hypothetical protein
MGDLKRIAVVMAIFAAISWIMVALSVAQTANLPPETPTHQTVPEATGSGNSGQSLGDKLDRSGGVIRPPSGVDPGLTRAPPESGGSTMPVIPPPGTPGGKPEAEPK